MIWIFLADLKRYIDLLSAIVSAQFEELCLPGFATNRNLPPSFGQPLYFALPKFVARHVAFFKAALFHLQYAGGGTLYFSLAKKQVPSHCCGNILQNNLDPAAVK